MSDMRCHLKKPQMNNLIDRQDAIDALGERPMVWMDSDYEIAQRNQYDRDKLAIETVPPAQPEPCEDAVSRETAIDAINAVFPVDPNKSEYASGIACGAALALTYIKQLPSAQPEEQRWIPAWQEYPQDNRFVLVCNDDGRCAVAQYIGHEVDAYHPWQIAYCPYDVDVWEDDEHGKIMAWMELPIPYKEKNNDERGSTSTFERLRSRILRGEQKPNTATQF